MNSKVKCFVAYPSEPASLSETIDEAIKQIKNGQAVEIDGWKSLFPTGNYIINRILEKIDSSDLFICDLTNLNYNVLFELGYAIAKKKRTWILLDTNNENSNHYFQNLRLLTTVGYSQYSNSIDITNAFYKEAPYENLDSTIYKDSIEKVINPRIEYKMLYLKSSIQTEASINLSRKIESSKIPKTVDDPIEVTYQSLSWYAQSVYSSYAVVAHFLCDEHTGNIIHNARTSLVCGLAHGFGKNLLMLAHSPFKTPIDYRDILKVHKTSKECKGIISAWLDKVETEYDQEIALNKEYISTEKAINDLQTISIGDHLAENESSEISNYFIKTSAYNDALRAKSAIFVGRKGSGKTANLLELAKELAEDKRNHVCVIKPIAYELEGIINMLQ